MRRFVALTCLFIALSVLPAPASDTGTFELVYRQENIVADEFHTKSDLLITVINLGVGKAEDVIVSIPVLNPYLFLDSPVFVFTIPGGRQAEILHKAEMPNDLIAIAEPEEKIVWRIEYTDEAGERIAVEIKGVRGE